MSGLFVPVSFGELLDKITILDIKRARIRDASKLENVSRELDELRNTWASAPESTWDIEELFSALKRVNERLWDIEDDIRTKERRQEFDAEFIRLARSVYFENDERARLKRGINLALGSRLIEEKSYEDYRGGAPPAPGPSAT